MNSEYEYYRGTVHTDGQGAVHAVRPKARRRYAATALCGVTVAAPWPGVPWFPFRVEEVEVSSRGCKRCLRAIEAIKGKVGS